MRKTVLRVVVAALLILLALGLPGCWVDCENMAVGCDDEDLPSYPETPAAQQSQDPERSAVPVCEAWRAQRVGRIDLVRYDRAFQCLASQ